MTRVELVPRIPGGRRPRGRIVGALPVDGASVTVQWDDGLTSGIRSQFLRKLPEPAVHPPSYSHCRWCSGYVPR